MEGKVIEVKWTCKYCRVKFPIPVFHNCWLDRVKVVVEDTELNARFNKIYHKLTSQEQQEDFCILLPLKVGLHGLEMHNKQLDLSHKFRDKMLKKYSVTVKIKK